MANFTIPGLDLEPPKAIKIGNKTLCIPPEYKNGTSRPKTDFSDVGIVRDGVFGKIFKCKEKNEKLVSVKKIELSRSTRSEVCPRLIRGIFITKNFNHENVLKMLEFVTSDFGNSIWIIFEACDWSLYDALRLRSHSNLFDYIARKNIIKQIFEGLSYMHFYSVVHGCLSPESILFTRAGILKIADVENRQKVLEGDVLNNGHSVRIVKYLAPEILIGSKMCAMPADVWSVGCILAELIKRKPLFEGNTEIEVLEHMAQILGSPENAWPEFSKLSDYEIITTNNCNFLSEIFKKIDENDKGCVAFLKKILYYNPSERYPAKHYLKDAYFNEACCTDDLASVLRYFFEQNIF